MSCHSFLSGCGSWTWNLACIWEVCVLFSSCLLTLLPTLLGEPCVSLEEIFLPSAWNPLWVLKLILLLEIRNLKVLVVFCPPHCRIPPLGSCMQSNSYTYVCMRRLWERGKLSEEKTTCRKKVYYLKIVLNIRACFPEAQPCKPEPPLHQ